MSDKHTPGTKCCGRTWPAGSCRSYPCSASAKVTRDGKPYCGRHDPLKVKAQREKRDAERNALWEAEKAARAGAEAERAERDRRADCFDDMLNTLLHIEEYWNRDQNEMAMADALWHIIDEASAAIAKAKGE